MQLSSHDRRYLDFSANICQRIACRFMTLKSRSLWPFTHGWLFCVTTHQKLAPYLHLRVSSSFGWKERNSPRYVEYIRRLVVYERLHFALTPHLRARMPPAASVTVNFPLVLRSNLMLDVMFISSNMVALDYLASFCRSITFDLQAIPPACCKPHRQLVPKLRYCHCNRGPPRYPKEACASLERRRRLLLVHAG